MLFESKEYKNPAKIFKKHKIQTITVAILGLIVAVAGTAFPAYKALRMSPAQAVHYTG